MILVLGSANMDLLLPVPRIPQPGETVLAGDYLMRLGGKGANQAVAAARAGARVAFAGAVGDDAYGRKIRANFSQEGVGSAFLAEVEAPTGLACVAIDAAGENAIMVAPGANAWASAESVASKLGKQTLLLLQMEIPAEVNWSALRAARMRGARTMLNLAPAGPLPAMAAANLDYLLLNRAETASAAAAFGVDGSPEQVVTPLAERLGVTIIATLGGAGAIAAEPGGRKWRQDALSVEVVDTTGAGDAFVGVFAAAVDAGRDLPEALRRAAIAAALTCEKISAQAGMPNAKEIEARLPALPPAWLL